MHSTTLLRLLRRFVVVSLLIGMMRSPGLAAESVELKVITTIQTAGAASPESVHWAVFQDGVAYDLSQTDPRFATILDWPRDEIVLLDRTERHQCVLAMESLLGVAASVRSEVTDATDRNRLGLLASIEEQADGQLAIEYPGVRYLVRPERPDPERVAADFGRYVDWMCRVSLVRPSGLPPFARITLNDHLAASGRIAQTTRVTLSRPGEPPRALVSETRWTTELDEPTIQQVQQIQAMRVTFPVVLLNQFADPPSR